jgi:hypothetical protein
MWRRNPCLGIRDGKGEGVPFLVDVVVYDRAIGRRRGQREQDRRYALSSEKLMHETGWKPEMDFERGLKATVDWYRDNPEWIAHVRSGEYQSSHDKNYANRNQEPRGISTS